MAKLTRRDLVIELAKVEQGLVTLEEQRGEVAVMDPALAAEVASKIAVAERVRDSLIRQLTVEDQATFNRQQVNINRRQFWTNVILTAATLVSALFAALSYCRPRAPLAHEQEASVQTPHSRAQTAPPTLQPGTGAAANSDAAQPGARRSAPDAGVR
jgi:hypothetical protein